MTEVILAAFLAQAATLEATSLARIRKALAEPAPIATSLVPKDGIVFRIHIRAPRPERPMWETRSFIPGYVRPSMTSTHFEYLSMTTPEAFRASTLYPGMSLGTLLNWLGGNESKEEVRRRKEGKARQEVMREFEAFLKAQTIK